MNIDYSCRSWHVDPEIVSGDFMSHGLAAVYDVIFLLGVLYHLENLPACMRQLRSLLVEGGVVYVETEMSQIESPLPIFEYASDIFPTVAIQDKKNLALVGHQQPPVPEPRRRSRTWRTPTTSSARRSRARTTPTRARTPTVSSSS